MGRQFAVMLLAAASAAVAACASSLPPMRPDANPAVPASQLAVVELSAALVTVDSISQGNRALYLMRRDNPNYAETQVELDPGNYTIAYHAICSLASRGDVAANVTLEGGHHYRAGGECCYWSAERSSCVSYWRAYWSAEPTEEALLWFEDLTTGQVLSGSREVPAARRVDTAGPE